MDNINLNGDAYNDKELENLLHLGSGYNTEDIEKAKYNLKKKH